MRNIRELQFQQFIVYIMFNIFICFRYKFKIVWMFMSSKEQAFIDRNKQQCIYKNEYRNKQIRKYKTLST